MSTVAEYVQGANLGDVVVRWLDTNGALRDFSDGWTFEVVVWPRGGSQRSFVAKTTGVTGDDEDPNVTVVWDDEGEVAELDPGLYNFQLSATKDGRNTKMLGHIWVRKGAPPDPPDEVILDGGGP